MKRKLYKGIALLFVLLMTSCAALADTAPALPTPPETFDTHIEWVKDYAPNMWRAEFAIPSGNAQYWLLENYMEGYTSPDMENPVNIGRGPYTVINTQELDIEYGDLVLMKNVSNPDNVTSAEAGFTVDDPDREFTFHIQLTNAEGLISGYQKFGETMFYKGAATVTLKDGDVVLFENIPAGTRYTITELTAPGFTTIANGNEGEIQANGFHQARFTNIVKKPPERNTTTLTLKKEVTGSYTTSGEFNVDASFAGLDAGKIYKYREYEGGSVTPEKKSFTADASGNYVGSFKLTADRYIVFEGIPCTTVENGKTLYGATYRFTESAGKYTSSYRITFDAAAGGIAAKSSDANLTEKKELNTQTERVDEGEVATVTFTNHFMRTVPVTVSKAVEGVDYGREYEFEVVFSGLEPDFPLYGKDRVVYADGNGKAVFPIKFTAGESYTFPSVPVRASYTVYEKREEHILGRYVVTENGAEIASAQDTADSQAKTFGFDGKASDGSTVTTREDHDVAIEFTNTLKTWPLTLSKRIDGTDYPRGSYEFTIHAENFVAVQAQEMKNADGEVTGHEAKILVKRAGEAKAAEETLPFVQIDDKTVEAKYSLADGDEMILTIFEGSTVTISEATGNYTTSISCDGSDAQPGFVVQCPDISAAHSVEFINTIQPMGSIRIEKTTTSDIGSAETPADTVFVIEGPNGFKREVKFSEFTDGGYLLPERVPVGLYTVTEKADTAKLTAYELDVQAASPDGLTPNEEDPATQVGSDPAVFAIRNVYTRRIIDVEVEKIWVDDGDRDRVRPQSVEIQLLRNGELRETKTLTGNTWRDAFEGLPEYDESGKLYVYTTKELPVEHYRTTPEISTADDGYRIYNIHDPETVSITVKKVWDDQNDWLKLRPKSVSFNVMNGSERVDTITLSAGADGIWDPEELTGTSGALLKYEDGTEIPYTVVEIDGDPYYRVSAPEKDGEYTYTFTNTLPYAVVSLSARKTLVPNGTLKEGQFRFVLADQDDKGKTYEVRNKADGSIVFPDLVYLLTDVNSKHTYTISEKQDGQAGIIYDTSKYTVEVKVSLDKQGNIVCEKTIRCGGKPCKEITFTNKEGELYYIEFNFYKQWNDGQTSHPTPQFELHYQNGNVAHKGEQPKLTDAAKGQYTYWVADYQDYYVTEKKMNGYMPKYENPESGKYAAVTDRVYNEGTITNATIPATGDSSNLKLLAVVGGASALCLGLLLAKRKRRG